jgi:hypothetical protein
MYRTWATTSPESLPLSRCSISARRGALAITRSPRRHSSRPRSDGVSCGHAPATKARCAAATAASASARLPRAIDPQAVPVNGFSVGRYAPPAGATCAPSM